MESPVRSDSSTGWLNVPRFRPRLHDETLNSAPKAPDSVIAFAHSSPVRSFAVMANPLVAPILGFLGRLSFPRLFLIAAALWAVDMVVPDFIPFIDELLLGIATLLLASFRRRKAPAVTETPAAKPPIEGQRSG